VKVPLVENGRVVGVYMLARDITEKVKSQEELFAQNRDLQEFAYIVFHNLRAPLANALGLVELPGRLGRWSPLRKQVGKEGAIIQGTQGIAQPLVAIAARKSRLRYLACLGRNRRTGLGV
jgi:signal transduction histidine kinase